LATEPSPPATQRLGIASLVFATIFAASLLGILTRPLGNLAAFWPANALFLGLMLRFPSLARPLGWLGGAIGYVAADMVTGSTLPKTLLLTAGNLVGVVTGYLLFSRLHADDLHMRRPLSVPWMALVVVAASAAAGVIGAIADPLLFGGDALRGWTFWFVTELVNYLAILPMVLTLPDWHLRLKDRRRSFVPAYAQIGRMVPAFAFGMSCVVSVFIGGPGALVFPIPALLWCALYYSVFTTTVLTVVFSAWALIALSMGYLALPLADANSRSMLLSIRIGVALVTLAPITVACVMESRNQLLQKYERLASHDQLSGLLNRHAFYERATSLLMQPGTRNYPAAVLMIDIDRFKVINDAFGHASGDQVLIAFSRLASTCFREVDVFGRIGGEEFAAVLPACSADSAMAIAERLRRTFADALIEIDTDHALSATVSIGVATIAQGPSKIGTLLLAADKALYRAKERGRNRVEYEDLTIARPSSPSSSWQVLPSRPL
jgi:diguanylate cyclase (GGDEF)-like protein